MPTQALRTGGGLARKGKVLTFIEEGVLTILRRLTRVLSSIVGVSAITYLAVRGIPVNAATVGFLYLLFVVIVATGWGFVEAAAASIVGTGLYNYFFLPPVGALTVADPQNWVALFTLLATSLIASRLSTKARMQAMEAVESRKDLERLYTLSRAILLIDSNDPNESFEQQLARRIAEAFELDAVVLYDSRTGETYRGGPSDLEGIDNELRLAASEGTTFSGEEGKSVIIAVRLGSQPIASLGLQGMVMPDSVLQSVANLVAIGLEQARAQDLAREVEVIKRSDRLRTTIIDALAHELKTPLTSIRAATSALLSNSPSQGSNSTQILKIADEEAAHLEELIDNALDMAQLDSDHIDVEREPANVEELVREVIASMKMKIGERRVAFSHDKEPIQANLDGNLLKLAIKQLLDNALKYSSSSQPINLHAFHRDGTVVVEVTDHGKGIPAKEQPHLFERFYRSPSVQRQVPGSGLGLSIADRIVRAHGGRMTVRSQPGETTFSIILPEE
jgi:two-component system sensor histidine kinase KdpD